MCNLECSREDADDEKTYKDHSKLIREGKTNTTTIYNINADIDPFHSWIIQACGLKLYFSTVVYAGKDLFVVVPQFNLNLPTVIGQLESFVSSIEYLLTFMQDMEKSAHASAAALHQARHNRTGKAIQRMNNREDRPPPPSTSKKASVPGSA